MTKGIVGGIQAGSGAEHGFAIKLMEHLVVPTFVLDADCRVIIWNKACEHLTGVPAEEVLGTREHWRGFYPTARPCLSDLVAQSRTAEIAALYAAHENPLSPVFGIHAENWCVMPRAGSELYLAIDAGPIFDEDGRLLAVVETLRDMTEHKRAQMALEHLAANDGLTGVANRRTFDDRLVSEWQRERRDRLPLSLVMIDVDHFKRYNDTYGHPAGDECLRRVAGALDDVVFRPGDLLARYGGEEFAIILPTTDLAGATIVAERAREAVGNLAIAHEAGEAGVVTLSMGVASVVPTPEVGADDLIVAADGALYRAKREGRNRIVSASALAA